MKLAISTYSLAKWQSSQNKSLEQCLDWIAGTGVKAVEFVDLGDKAQKIGPAKYASQLRRRCERLSLAVAGYCAPANLLVSPRAQRAMIEQLKSHVDIAYQLGCKSRPESSFPVPTLTPRSTANSVSLLLKRSSSAICLPRVGPQFGNCRHAQFELRVQSGRPHPGRGSHSLSVQREQAGARVLMDLQN